MKKADDQNNLKMKEKMNFYAKNEYVLGFCCKTKRKSMGYCCTCNKKPWDFAAHEYIFIADFPSNSAGLWTSAQSS